jgi:hypothetical protein
LEKKMTMAVRFSMISTYPGQGALMDGPDPAWRLPMSAFHWTRLDGLADSGVTTGDSIGFDRGGEVHLTAINFSGRQIHDSASGRFHDDAVVKLSWQEETGTLPATTTVQLTEAWNSIKNIEVTSLDTDGLVVRDFVDVRVDLDGDQDHSLTITNAKRGVLMTEGGNDHVTVAYASNEYNWSNVFRISTGAGTDTVQVHAQSEGDLPQATWSAPFNAHPEQTLARIDLGAGNDEAETHDCSGLIMGGAGNDTIRFFGGNMNVNGGDGRDTIIASIGPDHSAPSVSTVDGGAGRDSILVYDGLQADDFHVTVAVHKNETGRSIGRADEVRVGHQTADGGFELGSLSKLGFDLYGYADGSTAELVQTGVNTLLRVHDAGDSDLDVIKLVGQPVASVDDLHIQFIHS